MKGKQAYNRSAFVPSIGGLPGTRPPPPDYIENPEEREVWRTIVDRMPPNWFTAETFPVLTELCSATVTARKLNVEVAMMRGQRRTEGLSLGLFMRVTSLKNRTSALVASLSSKLRLTQQSRMNSEQAKSYAEKSSSSAKPWQVSDPLDSKHMLRSGRKADWEPN